MDDRLSRKMLPVRGTANQFEEVRFFNNESIQKAIDNAVKDVRVDSVLLKADVDGDGDLSAVLVARPGEHWTVGAVFKYDFTDKSYSGGAQVVFEW
jgi:2-phospho-L-lactate guanylyltransferase (CobY/MobA/RfbA family)